MVDFNYTLDGLTIDFTIPIHMHYGVIWDMFLRDLANSINHMRYGDLKKEWTSFQIGSYKYNYTFEIEKGSPGC